jgi:hypothetical protein
MMDVLTKGSYGCIYFEAKSKGPFRVSGENETFFEGFAIIANFGKGERVVGMWKTREYADSACKWLNKRWEEVEEKHSEIHEVRLYSPI